MCSISFSHLSWTFTLPTLRFLNESAFFPWIWKYFRLLLIIVVWRYFFGSVSHYTRCFVLLPLNCLSLKTQDEGQKFPQRCGEKSERGLRRDKVSFGEFVVCRLSLLRSEIYCQTILGSPEWKKYYHWIGSTWWLLENKWADEDDRKRIEGMRDRIRLSGKP